MRRLYLTDFRQRPVADSFTRDNDEILGSLVRVDTQMVLRLSSFSSSHPFITPEHVLVLISVIR
jgi:hypothetical protein